MDFPNEEAAVNYFKRNPNVFLNLEIEMGIYRPSFRENGVLLDNTNELVTVK